MTIAPTTEKELAKMNEADALDIFQAAIWTVLISSGPAVLAAMVVGLVIALIQALTQVQEATLTFVPKIVAVMVTIGITAPFVGSQIGIFTNLVFSRIQSGF
jgi:flagellar biosynthesis protein FliQ